MDRKRRTCASNAIRRVTGPMSAEQEAGTGGREAEAMADDTRNYLNQFLYFTLIDDLTLEAEDTEAEADLTKEETIHPEKRDASDAVR